MLCYPRLRDAAVRVPRVAQREREARQRHACHMRKVLPYEKVQIPSRAFLIWVGAQHARHQRVAPRAPARGDEAAGVPHAARVELDQPVEALPRCEQS